MNNFTFYFKFIGEENNKITADLFSFSIRATNIKEAVKVWTNYVQSADNMIVMTTIEKNGKRFSS